MGIDMEEYHVEDKPVSMNGSIYSSNVNTKCKLMQFVNCIKLLNKELH
jgi:hypothetical protein